MDYTTELQEYALREYFIGKGKVKVTVIDAQRRFAKAMGNATEIGFTSFFPAINEMIGDSDHDLPSSVGKYQYIYSSKDKKGQISLVETPDMGERHKWEIYSENVLFDDIEWFTNKEDAEARVLELLL